MSTTLAPDPSGPVLSILIASVPERIQQLASLVDSLQWQAGNRAIEILALTDNRKRTIGEKRNDLLQMARGQFIVFIDDDDTVSDDYVDSVHDAILAYPEIDAIGFNAIKRSGPAGCEAGSGADRSEKLLEFGQSMENRTPGAWPMPLTHICPVRASIAKQVQFPADNKGEDAVWAALVRQKIGPILRIPRVLYHYRYDAEQSAARGRKAYGDAGDLWRAVYESDESERPEFELSRQAAGWLTQEILSEKACTTKPIVIDLGSAVAMTAPNQLRSFLPPGSGYLALDAICPDEASHTIADLATPRGREHLRAMTRSGKPLDLGMCVHFLEHLPEHAVSRTLYSLAQVARESVVSIGLTPWRWRGHQLRRTLWTADRWLDELTGPWIMRQVVRRDADILLVRLASRVHCGASESDIADQASCSSGLSSSSSTNPSIFSSSSS